MKEEDEAELETFLQWAANLGISDCPVSHESSSSSCLGHSLCVSDFPDAGGRGLAAARDIRKGELILRVPNAALLTSDSVIGKHKKLCAAFKKYPLLSSTQILSVALLNEVNKGRNSWWYRYLKQMPQSYSLLSGYRQFEIESFQIDYGIWTAEKAVERSQMEWKEASPLMSELRLKSQLKTLKAWLWASATISSRTMHIPWDTAGCLCPVGDFFNYAPPEDPCHLENSEAYGTGNILDSSSSDGKRDENSLKELTNENTVRLTDAGYNDELSNYCFYARRNYRKGDQVLLCYGTYTNLELLEHYGFLLHENQNDKAYISLEPEMYSLCSWPKESLYISQDGKPSFALLSTLRLWATPLKKRKSIARLAYSGDQISLENEIAVMKWISQRCKALLSSYSTSTEEDTLMLHIIDKIQSYNRVSLEYEELSPAMNQEIHAFLERNHATSEEVSSKLYRSILRWKLAIQWRLGCKRILCDSISHCTKILETLTVVDLSNH